MKRLHDITTTVVLMASGGLLLTGNALASEHPEASLYALALGAIGFICGGELILMRKRFNNNIKQ